MRQILNDYIEASLAKGLTAEEIVTSLTNAGWSAQTVQRTLGLFAGVNPVGVPVPKNQQMSTNVARDLFLYLFLFIALCVFTTGINGIIFCLVDCIESPESDYVLTEMMYPTTQAIVFGGTYFLLHWVINAVLRKEPLSRESVIRKLCLFGILLFSLLIFLGTIFYLLYAVLSGNLSIIFDLYRSASVLTISGLVSVFYALMIKQDLQLAESLK
jgi:hypothetical protein